jgi:hypothetical protein
MAPALVLRQPWESLIVTGTEKVEERTTLDTVLLVKE